MQQRVVPWRDRSAVGCSQDSVTCTVCHGRCHHPPQFLNHLTIGGTPGPITDSASCKTCHLARRGDGASWSAIRHPRRRVASATGPARRHITMKRGWQRSPTASTTPRASAIPSLSVPQSTLRTRSRSTSMPWSTALARALPWSTTGSGAMARLTGPERLRGTRTPTLARSRSR